MGLLFQDTHKNNTKAVALVAVDKLYVNVHVCSVLHNLSVHRVIDGKLISAK